MSVEAPQQAPTTVETPAPTPEEVEALVNPVSVETNDTRELSPTASRLRNAANKVAMVLEQRTLNRLHGQALQEDNSRTEAAQNDAYDSYSDNIAATQSRELLNPDDGKDMAFDRFKVRQEVANAAYKAEYTPKKREAYETAQKLEESERQKLQEAREARIEDAKKFVKNVGRSALKSTIDTGTTLLGIGLLAGEAIVNTTVTAVEKGRDLAETAVDRGRDVVTGTVDSLRQKLTDQAEVATIRRDARRTRWSTRKDLLVNRGREAIGTAKEKGRETLGRAQAARAAGSAALAAVASAKEAAKKTYSSHVDQNRL